MRALLIVCICASGAFAQETPAPETVTSPGHSLFESNRKVRLIPRLVTVRQDQLAKEGVLPQTAVPDRTLTIAETDDMSDSGKGGVRLISARTVVERQVPVFVQVLSKTRTSRLLKKVFTDTHANVQFSPVSVVRHGETADFNDITEQPYLVGYSKNGRQIDFIENGIQVLARPQIRSDDKIHLDLAIRCNKVMSVERIPGANTDEQVVIPEVHSSEIKLAADVTTGQTIMVGGINSPNEVIAASGKSAWFGWSKSAPPQSQQVIIMFTAEIVDGVKDSPARRQAGLPEAPARSTVRSQSP